MKIWSIISLILIEFTFLIASITFISSSFACGFVEDSNKFSSDWTIIRVYFEENESDFTECQVSPEKKFCCDLENISSVDFAAGKKVFAEVYDLKRGLVSSPVSLYLTEQGYNVFPNIQIKEAFNFNVSDIFISVNSSSIPTKFSSEKNLNNILYKINSSGEIIEGELCNGCNNSDFIIPLSKGENKITLISENDNELSKKITIYNLDYFEIGINVFCDRCKIKKNFLYIPSGEEIIVNSYFNSSHNISGEFLIYLPKDWILIEFFNSSDFSLTHQGIIEEIKDKSYFSINYTIKAPKNIVKQDYIIYQKINGYNHPTKVRSFKFKIFPFHKSNIFQESYPEGVLQQSSFKDRPVILNIQKEYLETVAIFTKSEVFSSFSYVNHEFESQGKINEIKFNILTSIPENEIESILLIFKVEKGKSIEVKHKNNLLPLNIYKQDLDYIYYSVYIQEKAPFEVKVY